MRKFFGLTMTVILVLSSLLAVSEAADRKSVVSIIHEGIKFSESVYPYEDGLFISNFGSDEMNPRPDENKGYILYLKDGKMNTIVPADGTLHKPTGMIVKDGQLFVCDETRLVVFNLNQLKSAPQIIKFPAENKVLNALAMNEDTLYISVTDTGRIYSLDISDPHHMTGKKPQEWLHIAGPNGMTIGNGTMYIATIPADYRTVQSENVIYRVRDLSRPIAEKFIEVPGLYDGIALSDDCKTLYVSDWKTASVLAIDIRTTVSRTIYEEVGSGPADIAQKNGRLFIPELMGSKIVEIQLL